jgi:hypothetical protein
MKEIQLTQGYVALVDDRDFSRVNQFKWSAQIDRRKDGYIHTIYAKRNVTRKDGSQTVQYLHRLILNITDPETKVDHKDHNGLNNQRYNLRKATHGQNQRNQRLYATSTSGFKGASWHKILEKWQGNIFDGKCKCIGYFSSKIEAARAYDAAAVKAFGKWACTNVSLGLLPALGLEAE